MNSLTLAPDYGCQMTFQIPERQRLADQVEWAVLLTPSFGEESGIRARRGGYQSSQHPEYMRFKGAALLRAQRECATTSGRFTTPSATCSALPAPVHGTIWVSRYFQWVALAPKIGGGLEVSFPLPGIDPGRR